jgi:gas vesicle protein
MAIKGAKRRKTTDQVHDLAEQHTEEVLRTTEEAVERVEDQAQQVAGRAMLREAPYAGIGLGHVVAETVRNLDATSLPERLRRTPGAVASKVGDLGTNVKVSYLALAARGRAVSLSSAGDDLPGEVRKQTEAVADLTKDTATATGDIATDAVDQAGDTAAATGGKVKGVVGKLKGATARTAKPAVEQAGDAAGPTATTSESASDTGTGPLEKRTVAQLRERASELGVAGRAGMKKKELIRAIRDAT